MSGSCKYKHNNLNLRILPYKCFVMQKYSALSVDIPGMVNHATSNETAKIIVAPYWADTVSHATRNETAKITVTTYY